MPLQWSFQAALVRILLEDALIVWVKSRSMANNANNSGKFYLVSFKNSDNVREETTWFYKLLRSQKKYEYLCNHFYAVIEISHEAASFILEANGILASDYDKECPDGFLLGKETIKWHSF